MCLDLILERWQSFLFQISVCLAGEKGKCPDGSRRLPAAVHSDYGVCLAGEKGNVQRVVGGYRLLFILTMVYVLQEKRERTRGRYGDSSSCSF